VIKSRRVRWAGYVERMGELKNAREILVEKSERKRQLRRSRHRWEIILEWILGKRAGKLWRLDVSDSG